MLTDSEKADLNNITDKIIGCAYTVSNKLGNGFLERVYENALAYELKKAGIQVDQQSGIQVRYDEVIVGDYIADLLIEEKVILEIKAVKDLDDIHLAQCLNYLKATGLKICLLINFGKPKVEIKRLVNNF